MNTLQSPINNRKLFRLVLLGVVALAAILTLGILYGIFPGLRPSAGMQQFFLGLAACYAEHLPGSIRCDAVAQPTEYTTMFGLPVVLMISALYKLGFALDVAGLVVEAAVLVIAAWGAHRLFMALGIRAWLSAVMAFVFLCSPIVFAQDGYGPLRLGFALVPLYGWLDYHFARRIRQTDDRVGMLRLALIGILVLSISRSFALYADGYSFVMGLMLSVTLVGSQWVPLACRRRWTPVVLLPVLFALPTLVAYTAYRVYVGGTFESSIMPIDYFRGQGADLFALAVPSTMHWLANSLGWSHHLTGWMSYSDGWSVTLAYMGWSLVILGLIYAAIVICGRGPGKVRVEGILLTVMTVAALVLSFGPSLKIADFREQPPPDRGIVFDDYHMPESAATIALGTAWIYHNVPGVRNMRAVYRWLLLVKLGLIILAGLFLDYLLNRKRRRLLVYAIVALLLIELAPDIESRLVYGERNYGQYHEFANDALASLKAMGLAGSRVVFVHAESDPDENHYLANFLCPLADLKCFNLGGDKSLQLARSNWPRPLQELVRGRHVAGNLRQLMLDESVDHVIMPLFSLRQAAYWWPPQESRIRQRLEYARKLASQAAAGIERQDDCGWFVLFSADESAVGAGKADDSPELGKVVEIEDWGPKAVERGSGFNIQQDGRSSFWVRVTEVSEPMGRFALLLDGEILETFPGGDIISARFWQEYDVRALAGAWSHVFALVNGLMIARSRVGWIRSRTASK